MTAKKQEIFICPLDGGLRSSPEYLLVTALMQQGLNEAEIKKRLEEMGYKIKEKKGGY